jgi:hypothetical protein
MDDTLHFAAIPDFNQQTYLSILTERGIDEALSALHQDIIRWEHNAFEGPKGYQPEVIAALEKVRIFSRELWAKVNTP